MPIRKTYSQCATPDVNAASAVFYAALMDSLRRHLAAVRGPAAFSMTPRELRDSVPARATPPPDQPDVFRRAELALYAGAEMTRDQHAQDLDAAMRACAISPEPDARGGADDAL